MQPVLMFSLLLSSTSRGLGGSSWLSTPSKCSFLISAYLPPLSWATCLPRFHPPTQTLKPPTQCSGHLVQSPHISLFSVPQLLDLRLHKNPVVSATVSYHLPIQHLVPFTHIPPLLSCLGHMFIVFFASFCCSSPRSLY